MIKIEIINGIAGYCLAINDTRVAGPKPLGGGVVTNAFIASREEIMKAMGGTEDRIYNDVKRPNGDG